MSPFIHERVKLLKQRNFRGIRSDLQECFRKTLNDVEEDTEEEQNLSSQTDDENKERVLPKIKTSQRKRCQGCERHKDKKTAIMCSKCEKFFSKPNSIQFFLCKACYDEMHARNIRLIRANSDQIRRQI